MLCNRDLFLTQEFSFFHLEFLGLESEFLFLHFQLGLHELEFVGGFGLHKPHLVFLPDTYLPYSLDSHRTKLALNHVH